MPGERAGLAAFICVCATLFVALFTGSLHAVEAGETERRLVVGGDKNYPPYEYLDSSGKPAGFNVDLTRAIGEAMGVEMEVVLFDWSQLYTALSTETVDALQRIPASRKWLAAAELSPPAALISHAVFSRSDTPEISSLADLAGKKVIIHSGGSVHDILSGLGLEREFIFSQTPTDGLRLLSSGLGDYAVVPLLPGLSTIKSENLKNIKVVIRHVTTQGYSYAVRRGDESTLAVFNEGLALVRLSGRYQEIQHKWFGVMESRSISWNMALRYAAAFLAPLLLLLGGTVLWSRSLRRQVNQRTQSLSKALEELRRNQQQLAQADKMAALGVLVSGVAHEINNPNGLILLNLQILRNLNEEVTNILDELYAEKGDFTIGNSSYLRIRDRLPRVLESTEESSRRIKRIVDDLRDFSRGNNPAEQEPVDLNDVAARAVRLLEATVRKSTNHFEVSYGRDLPKVMGNRHRLEQVAVNLILNACQALRGPEESIAVSTVYDNESKSVLLSVRDTGVGIAKDNMERLTDPFFTTKRTEGGTGLGLSVSAGIAKEHGGCLRFNSVPGQGATVNCVIPINGGAQV